MKYLLSLIIASILLSGCGRKGRLIPPEALIPAPIEDLAVSQRGESFLVSWTIPDRDEGGGPVKELYSFRVFKRKVLPPDEDCESCADAYQVLQEIYPAYLRDARREDGRLFITDPGVTDGIKYQYKVISYLRDGTPSHDSNKFRLVKIDPLPPPRLKAVSTPTSVKLHWEGSDVPGYVKARGYNIYRWRANDPPSVVPMNETPIRASDLEDFRLRRGTTYLYAVRRVADADGILVESVSSNEVRGAQTEPD
jgi:hypothetical protein